MFQEPLPEFARYILLQGLVPMVTSNFLETTNALSPSILVANLDNVVVANGKASVKLEPAVQQLQEVPKLQGFVKVKIESLDEDGPHVYNEDEEHPENSRRCGDGPVIQLKQWCGNNNGQRSSSEGHGVEDK